MNAARPFEATSQSFATRHILAASFLAGALAASGAAEPATTKTYILFEGVNISVGQNGELHPVRDISGSSWVVSVNGNEVPVSSDRGPINMKITPQRKLTETAAVLSDLKGERGYTFANDPSVKMTRSFTQFAQVDAGSHASVSQATSDATGLASVRPFCNIAGYSASTSTANNTGSKAAMEDSGSASSLQDILPGATAKEEGSFDALDVSFNVSSRTQLGSPYLVVIAKFRERNADAGTSKDLVYARALPPIDAKGIKVKFEQAGFPPGYVLKDFEIHLYDKGMEVATNIARGRRVLTSDQAFDYVRTMYIDAHKGRGDTLPATPVMGNLPSDLSAQVAAGKYGSPIFVKVSKDGLAERVFSDPACALPIDDPYLESLVQGIRFKPALAKGEPVDGVASLNLSRLRI
jgi:hypothetical protein